MLVIIIIHVIHSGLWFYHMDMDRTINLNELHELSYGSITWIWIYIYTVRMDMYNRTADVKSITLTSCPSAAGSVTSDLFLMSSGASTQVKITPRWTHCHLHLRSIVGKV